MRDWLLIFYRPRLRWSGDGRSDWLKGIQLLAVYVILGLAFFFAPGTPVH